MLEDTLSEDTRFDAIRERIQRGLVEHGIPSLSVAVARGATVLWEEGFGWADRERRIPATPHTMYSLASISKPITTTGLMILKERGLLDLDRPINEYLGDSRLQVHVGSATEATVRRVANHTSGLPLHYQFFYEDEPYRSPSMDETIRRYGHLMNAPGEHYQYSNLGYGILGEVIARLSGKSYADFMREEVFLPLGMLRASVDLGPGMEEFQAQRYDEGGSLYPFYDCDHPAASSVYCSAHDLLRFGMFHLKQHLSDQKAILSDEAIDEMQVPTTASGDTDGYGIGWGIHNGIPDYVVVGHGGGMGGVRTQLSIIPAAQVAVVVLCNGDGEAASALVDQVAVDIFSELLPPYAENRALSMQKRKPEKDDKAEPDFRPDERLLGQWSGHVHTYEGDVPLTLWFKEDGDIHARLGKQLKTLLNRPRFKEQRLTGEMTGTINTVDTRRYLHGLHLDLKQREDRLSGSATAMTYETVVQGWRCGHALSFWTELKKDA
ncbi:serine hydrolase domain-containing protein [Dictyobacter aurantiacus]|uniref:Beta-lactamase-related domain-containing protein n=1 Tax=Dictyobacter aurantiacus TaxID=1936993 RepID=A0A401ZJE8_9CHLR|nr:serine hydrolase domain-containing protein [Dictyobacter aurantiacus]GCE06981.1 hypothetical protein KDAU_43100 [Dictyobacter aurantiacus]